MLGLGPQPNPLATDLLSWEQLHDCVLENLQPLQDRQAARR